MSKNIEENSYILDAESPSELARLINLDRFTTKAMGGPLNGLPHDLELHQVLDLACGPGGWVLDVAFTHPGAEVAGVDVSKIMIDYANARARSQRIPNASFEVMDITQPLAFSDNSFDLVNARFLMGVLSRPGWNTLLSECRRILRPGGILRLTEPVDTGATTSAAFEKLQGMVALALHRIGYGFSPDGRKVVMTAVLPKLLRDFGFRDIQSTGHMLEFSADTEAWADYMHNNIEIGARLAKPLFLKTNVAKEEEYEQVYQQTLIEMHMDDFCGIWHYATVWGAKPRE